MTLDDQVEALISNICFNPELVMPGRKPLNVGSGKTQVSNDDACHVRTASYVPEEFGLDEAVYAGSFAFTSVMGFRNRLPTFAVAPPIEYGPDKNAVNESTSWIAD